MGMIELAEDELRGIALWSAECAEHVLPLFEVKVPGDSRPREAIVGARAFAHGGPRTAQLRMLAWGANAAAREAGDPVAAAAARAALLAAGAAYTHPLVSAHQVRHVVGAAAYAVQARELADGSAAGEAELAWAIERAPEAARAVVRRMMQPAPGKGRLVTLFYQLDAALRG